MSIQYEGLLDGASFKNLASTDDSLPVVVLDPSSRGTTWYVAAFLVVNAALGAGLLDFPLAFSQAGGIVVALLVQAVLIVCVVVALVIIAYCSDANRDATYQDVVLSACGKRAQQICSLVISIYCYGSCVTFVIIVGDQMDRVLASLYGSDFCHSWYMTRYFTTSVSFVILVLPLSFSKKIDFLKYASIFGVLSILYVVFLLIYKYVEGKVEPGPIKTTPEKWTDVFLVVPVICFGYQCHVSSIPIYSCLEDRNLKAFLQTIIMAMVICVATYTLAAIFGFLTFGDKVSSDILYAYEANDPVVLVGIVALTIKTFTTYPMLLFCGREAVDDLYKQVRTLSPEIALVSENRRRKVIVLVWFVSSVSLALVIPNIGVVISILGSLAALFIFVFPGMCLLGVVLKRDPDIRETKNRILVGISVMFVTIGMFLFGLVLTQAILRDVTGGGESAIIVLCQ